MHNIKLLLVFTPILFGKNFHKNLLHEIFEIVFNDSFLDVKSGILSGNNTQFSIGIKFNNAENMINSSNSLNYTLYPTNRVWMFMDALWKHTRGIPRYSIPPLHKIIELQRAIDVSFLHFKNISEPKVKFIVKYNNI